MARQRKGFSPPLPVALAIPSPPALVETPVVTLSHPAVQLPAPDRFATLRLARPVSHELRLRTSPQLIVVDRLPLTEVAFPTFLTQAGPQGSGFEKSLNKIRVPPSNDLTGVDGSPGRQ